jgi:hypothetical protein
MYKLDDGQKKETAASANSKVDIKTEKFETPHLARRHSQSRPAAVESFDKPEHDEEATNKMGNDLMSHWKSIGTLTIEISQVWWSRKCKKPRKLTLYLLLFSGRAGNCIIPWEL